MGSFDAGCHIIGRSTPPPWGSCPGFLSNRSVHPPPCDVVRGSCPTQFVRGQLPGGSGSGVNSVSSEVPLGNTSEVSPKEFVALATGQSFGPCGPPGPILANLDSPPRVCVVGGVILTSGVLRPALHTESSSS